MKILTALVLRVCFVDDPFSADMVAREVPRAQKQDAQWCVFVVGDCKRADMRVFRAPHGEASYYVSELVDTCR